MDCEWMERVSLSIDGELNGDEQSRLEAHVAGCEVCQRARAGFLALRGALRAERPAVDQLAERRALQAVLAAPPTPLWRRRIPVPIPAAAAAVAVMVALAALAVRTAEPARAPSQAVPAADPPPTGLVDLSRFDGGDRMVVRVVDRPREVGEVVR
jgi:anti-sigma factor RsiW